MIHVTRHACQRYQQRVESVTQKVAKARILEHDRALTIAANFGAPVVLLRLLVQGGSVVSVFGPGMHIGPVAR